MNRRSRLLVLAVIAEAVAACGGVGDVAEAPATSPPGTTVSSSIVPTSATQVASTSAQPTTSTTSSPVAVSDVRVPPGRVAARAGDVFAVGVDGDVWLLSGVVDDAPSGAVRLIDLADPRVESREGPGPTMSTRSSGRSTGPCSTRTAASRCRGTCTR